MQHPGRVFSREQLLDAVWGSDVYVEARTVDVHIGRLRKALNREVGQDPIRTVRSAGYRSPGRGGLVSRAQAEPSSRPKREKESRDPGPNAVKNCPGSAVPAVSGMTRL